MTNEEIKLLNEMKENCLNSAKYIDPKSMEKYNLLRKLEDGLNNWNELRIWLEELIKESGLEGIIQASIFNHVLDKLNELEERKNV